MKGVSGNFDVIEIFEPIHTYIPNQVLLIRFFFLYSFYIHDDSITFKRKIRFHLVIGGRKLINFRVCCRDLPVHDIDKQ